MFKHMFLVKNANNDILSPTMLQSDNFDLDSLLKTFHISDFILTLRLMMFCLLLFHVYIWYTGIYSGTVFYIKFFFYYIIALRIINIKTSIAGITLVLISFLLIILDDL